MVATSIGNEARPVALPVVFNSIPPDIRALPAVVWRYVEDRDPETGDVDWDKPPVNARTGGLASTTNPKTWSDFTVAEKAYARNVWDGIGVVLHRKPGEDAVEGIVAIDLDKCRDPESGLIDLWASRIIGRLNSYTEASPSGRGIRIFVRGFLPKNGRKKGRFECYQTGRYVTVTGQYITNTPPTVETRQMELESIHREVFGEPKAAAANGASQAKPLCLADAEIIALAGKAKNGQKFQKLWAGDRGDYRSASEADAALCNYLAFWCGPHQERIADLFAQSGLYRSKWNREDYRRRTIALALKGRTEFFEPGRSMNGDSHKSNSVDRAGEQGQPPPLKTFTLAELLAESIPEPRWAVPGLLCEGLTILAGKPKLGKSWMALNLAITIAGGGTALNNQKTTEGDVLYLALEDRKRRLQDRANRLLPGIDCGRKGDARLYMAVACPRMLDGGLDQIEKWIGSVDRPTLVVIDVWQKFRPMLKNGSQYEQDYAHANAAKELADKHACSILIVHHTKKAPAEDVMDEVSGTLGLVGAADGTMVLVRARNENEGKLHLTGRDIEEQELALQFNPHTFAWRSLGDARKRDASRVKTAILSIFQRSPGSAFWPSEMAEMIEMEKGVVKTTMWRMERDGELKKIGSKYGWPADEVGGGQWEEVSDPPSGSL